MTTLFGILTITFAALFGYSIYALKIVRDENKELKATIRDLRQYKGNPFLDILKEMEE